MSVDVVVTATAFMDITFIGLESVPAPGEERFARRPAALARRRRRSTRSASPGSGCARRSPSPLGDDLDGRFIRAALEREGIELSATGGRADADHRRDALGRRARHGHLRAGRQHERRATSRAF